MSKTLSLSKSDTTRELITRLLSFRMTHPLLHNHYPKTEFSIFQNLGVFHNTWMAAF